MDTPDHAPAAAPATSTNPDWVPIAITGTIHVYVVPCEPLDDDQADELHAVIERFLDALRLRMFPGTLRVVHGVDRGDDGKAHARFDVVELDLGALRVLHGMLNWFAMMVAPLGTMMAWCEPVGTTPNLFDLDVPLPVHHGPLPFAVTSTLGSTTATPSLTVEVRFAHALTPEDQHRLGHELRVWAALVHGGYPEPGELPGSSTIALLSIRFDDRHTLRLHADAILASDACLEPLKALVAGWSATIPAILT
jgi:hypothetical protein